MGELQHMQMAWKAMRSTKMLEDMDRPGFFKQYYQTVRQSITNDVLQEFSKLSSDEEKVRFCYEKIPAVHEIDIRTFYHGKSERDALERKEAGNKAFGRKKNVEALHCYSQAVVKAPVLSEENADPRKMTLYPICLANRSAALYHLKDFYYCVKDIDEALEHHYPKELKFKLYKRKARILVDLKRHLEARDSFRQALKWLDWAKMDRDKRMEVQKDIQKWLSIFESGKVVKNVGDFRVKLFPTVPPLTQGPHSVFPTLSSKLEMRYSPTQGRYVVAAQDIEFGDVVCT
ncbi:SET and MYND domain-containing protein 4-like, partial [Hyalella azteca]|uniref:SET and MYND domain-containing protein 4-like n=1 Tax=Hyalella azteca TaxID=294128 RepID=A0A8B7NP24_HYAAZ